MKISSILAFVLVAGILGVAIFTTGCVQEQQSDVGMAVEFNDHAACAYVAKEKGWYKEEGLNFTAYPIYDRTEGEARKPKVSAEFGLGF